MNLWQAKAKDLFLSVIARAKSKFVFDLWTFAVLDNHFHLLIMPGQGESLSKIMQWIKGNFAKKWNKEHHTKGHFWGERFFSRIIETEEEFAVIERYIDGNPVKAGMTKRGEDFKFCGLYYKVRGIFTLISRLVSLENLFPHGPPPAPG
jgi:putative transposase